VTGKFSQYIPLAMYVGRFRKKQN